MKAAGKKSALLKKHGMLRDSLDPARLTIAMWDGSWIKCHYPGASYEDFDKVTDELLERGFNTVRIDPFPWIFAGMKSHDEEITFQETPLRTWAPCVGNRRHRLHSELREFMDLTRKKGLRVILSTWNRGCMEYPGAADMTPKTMDDCLPHVDGWKKVLSFLDENNLLGHVLYVDYDQEFCCCSPYKNFVDLLGGKTVSEKLDDQKIWAQAANYADSIGLIWNDEQLVLVRKIFEHILRQFRELHPRLKHTFSVNSRADELMALNLDWDVVEIHFWTDTRLDGRTRFYSVDKDRNPDSDFSDYQRRVDASFSHMRPLLMRNIRSRMRKAVEWTEEIGAPLTCTEGWGPWWHMDHPDLSWGWLKDWCAECVAAASELGFWGVTPWNFSHPYWKSWGDVKWYREVNGAFLKS